VQVEHVANRRWYTAFEMSRTYCSAIAPRNINVQHIERRVALRQV
tara:strand:- start:598 stop:732 length:135 start_codon:yes stop_codon:yes gene_type:complete